VGGKKSNKVISAYEPTYRGKAVSEKIEQKKKGGSSKKPGKRSTLAISGRQKKEKAVKKKGRCL